ncbi:MAG: vWA domain-containing protein, partial [Planctomycetota bacterium]
VAAYELTPSQQEMIARHVHDRGGGLLMVGGPRSFGAGGWNGTPVERVLPLEMDPPSGLLLPQAALVLVLDKSGSMNRRVAGARASQQEVANEAAALAIESLRGQTLVGVITFDIRPRVRVPLQPAEDRTALADQVRTISAEGGTNLAPALQRAYEMLRTVDVDRKRIVCLSDGESPTSGLDDIAERMAAANIRLTTIAVGDDADYETLQRLAELGKGEFYPVRDPRKLPRILVDSVQVLNQPLLKEVPFVPVVLPTGGTLTAGMDQAPVLDGLVITSPREEATVVIEMTHPDGEPLLATWQAGLGRAAAFTSDAHGHWSQRWLAWPGATAFWTQLARMTARPAVDLKTELRATIEDDSLGVVFEATDAAGDYLDYLQVEGTVYGPDGGSSPLRLRQTAPGRYEGSVAALPSGNYIVALSPSHGDRRLAPAIGGASKATSPEFRRLESDLGLLEQLVDLTRGRLLRLDEPTAVDLFDRDGMPTSVSSLPIWRPVAWLVLALMLLDVASRRIAWDAAQLRALVARAFARFRPASRAEVATETLSSLRQVSDRFDERIAGDRRRAGTEAPMRPAPPGAAPEERTIEPEPAPKAPPDAEAPPRDARKVRAALDALLGRRTRTEEPARQEEPADEEDVEREREQTTSNLLAAKRRARDRLGGGS